MSKQQRWRCTTCGSQRVFRDAWVAMNDDQEDLVFDEIHCDDGCDSTSADLVEVEVEDGAL